MNGGRYWAAAIPTLWLAAVLQQAVAPRIAILGTAPDFLLAALTALALLGERRSGMLGGFLAGLLRGCLAGSSLTPYLIGRTIVGYGLGWVRSAGLIPNAAVAGAAGFVATLVSQGVLMMLAHRGPLVPFLTGTLITAAINGALAMPLYALLRRVIDPNNDR